MPNLKNNNLRIDLLSGTFTLVIPDTWRTVVLTFLLAEENYNYGIKLFCEQSC